jgi:hypothetical protein
VRQILITRVGEECGDETLVEVIVMNGGRVRTNWSRPVTLFKALEEVRKLGVEE